MRISNRIFINAASSWLAQSCRGILGLVLVPFLLGHLGREGYGLIGLMGAIVAFSGLADFGLRDAMSRELAEQIARKNQRRFDELVSTGAAAYLVIGLLLAAGLVIAAPWVANVLRVSERHRAEALFLIRWYAGGEVLLTFVRPVFSSVIAAYNRHAAANRVHMLMSLARSVLIIVLLALTPAGLYGYTVVVLAALCVEIVLLAREARRIGGRLVIRPWDCTREALRSLVGISKYIFPLRVSSYISVQANPIILTSFFGPGAVALYSPASALSALAQPVVSTLANQLTPLATAYHSVGQKAALRQLLVRGTKYTLMMGIPVCVVLGVFAEPIMRVWLGGRLGEDCLIVAAVLVWSVVSDLFAYAGGTQFPVFFAMRKLKFLVWTQLPLAAVDVIASALLVKYTSLGVVGVVIPSAVIGIIRRPFVAAYISRACGLRPMQYLRRSYVGPAAMLAMLAALAWMLRRVLPQDSLAALLGAAAAVGVLALPCGWWLALNVRERASVQRLARSMLGRMAMRLGLWRASPPAEGERAAAEGDPLAVAEQPEKRQLAQAGAEVEAK